MKIYIAHANGFDYRKELYEPLRGSLLGTEYQIILPYEHAAAPENSKHTISSCDLVIAEVSYPSIGLGIELGWAESFGKPIVCIHQKDAKVSRSLRIVTDCFLEYGDEVELVEKLSSELQNRRGS